MDQPSTDYANSGSTTIAPEVLLTIIQLTARNTQGVHHLASLPKSMTHIFKRGYGEGVGIDILDDQVYVDLYVVMNRNVIIRDVSRQLQSEVARAISEMLGMKVGRVNVHIEDIYYQPPAAPAEPAK